MLTYIAQKSYEKAIQNIQLAEEFLEDSDEEMGAYIYINKTILFQKMDRMQEALQAYEDCVNKYHADVVLPDDAMLCAATLFYKLGQKEKYEEYKKQILFKMDDMYAAEFMDACRQNDTEAILKALELKNYYKDQIILYSEQKRVQSLRESMEINTQLQKAIESREQAVRAKSQFLANMSHDIRTPINGIMGMLNIIRKAEEAGIQVTEEHDDLHDIYVLGNSLYIKKILINLFSNCIKYNKPGGSIYTRMKILERTKEHITCEFYIEDSGVGMSQDFIENKLFEPFMQAEESSRSSYVGTGLGMSIVRQLVEKMGGTIRVESRLGEGSSFTVVIPFEMDQQKNVEQTEHVRNTDMTGMCFLVAEDNELNMEIIDFLLTEEGVQVVHAKNGLEAQQRFEASDEGYFDAILMDLMMPVMDSLTSAKAIRASHHPQAQTIPIIAMTANAFAEDAKKCMEAGMNAHLAKPLDVNKVMTTISKEVREKR